MIINRKIQMKNNHNDSESKNTNENIPNDSQKFNIPIFDEEHEKLLEANENINKTLDVAMNQLKSLIDFLKNYRESRFAIAMKSAITITKTW
jgi:hypothetical protein